MNGCAGFFAFEVGVGVGGSRALSPIKKQLDRCFFIGTLVPVHLAHSEP